MNTGVSVYKITHLSDLECVGCIFECLLHLSRPKESEVTTFLTRSALTVLHRQFLKLSTRLNLLNKLLHTICCFLLSSCDCLASASDYWIPGASVLEQDVTSSDCRYKVKQFNIESKRGSLWNNRWMSCFTICIFMWAD